MTAKTPISLITGSLGAGKTTLLKRIIDHPPARLAVLMNEFGEIAIDSQIIQGKNIQMIELAGGCVCCSLVGEFEAAVNEIIDNVQPELIVLEATGVAEADAIVFEVEENVPRVRLDSVIYVLDAYAGKKFPETGYVARTQLQAADCVLVNKVDLISPYDVKVVEEEVKKFNDRAVIFKTQHCQIDIDLLFGVNVERYIPLSKSPGHSELESFSFTTTRFLDREKFEEFCLHLPSSILRAKGFVIFKENSFLFNYVLGRYEFEVFKREETQLVFIGPRIHRYQEEIIKQLQECEL